MVVTVTFALEQRDVIPGAPFLTQFFTEKVNKTDRQNK